MENSASSRNPQRNGYRIEWEVTPSIDTKGGEKTYEEEGIELFFNGMTLSAEIMDTDLNWEEFYRKAELIANREFISPAMLVRDQRYKLKKLHHRIWRDGRWGEFLHHTTGVAISSSISFKVLDKEGNVIRDSEEEDRILEQDIRELSKRDITLSRISEYYRLVNIGKNVTFNLYKILNALEKRFGKIKGLTSREHVANLLAIPLEFLKKIGQITNEGKYDQRHAPGPEEETQSIPVEHLKECRHYAKSLILAYVEWLKENA